MQCPIHPELPARYRCEKYDLNMCERCIKCHSPKVHCKHRQQCIIWELLAEELKGSSPDGDEDATAG